MRGAFDLWKALPRARPYLRPYRKLLAVSMVATGAYLALTGLVGLDSAITAMEESLPSYRRQHAEGNAIALRTGAELVDSLAAPAWPAVTAARA